VTARSAEREQPAGTIAEHLIPAVRAAPPEIAVGARLVEAWLAAGHLEEHLTRGRAKALAEGLFEACQTEADG